VHSCAQQSNPHQGSQLSCLQSAREAADLFSRQFPSSRGDLKRIQASITEEEKRREVLAEQATACRSLLREQTGTSLRRARADQRQEGGAAPYRNTL